MFSFFLIFYLPYPGLRNCKSVFLILKILQYGGLRRPMINTKSGQQVHLQDLTQMKLIKPVLVTSFVKTTLQPKTLYLYYQTMATKIGRMVTYHIITCFCEITWQTKNIVSPLTLIATKRGRMMTYHEWLLQINSHNYIIMWPRSITWQTKIVTHLLTQCL